MSGQPKGKKWKKVREKLSDLQPKIIEMRQNGKTHAEIGRVFNIKKGTIQSICARLSVDPIKPGRGRIHRKKGERGTIYYEIVRLRGEGLKGREIANRLGLKDAKEVKDIVKYWRTDRAPEQKKHTKEGLEKIARLLIRKAGRYVGGREICKDLRVGSASFARQGISITDLNAAEGFKSPYSIFQLAVESVLRSRFSRVLTEHTFDECKSPRGFFLRFDFFVPEINLLIEADGLQHDVERFKDTSYYTDAKYRQKCDKIKDHFARDRGIPFVRIPYSGKVTEDYVMSYLAKEVDPSTIPPSPCHDLPERKSSPEENS